MTFLANAALITSPMILLLVVNYSYWFLERDIQMLLSSNPCYFSVLFKEILPIDILQVHKLAASVVGEMPPTSIAHSFE
jgi:hypothetical protein